MAKNAEKDYRTPSGIPVETCYEGLKSGIEDRLGSPGAPPYTRGIHPDMYRGRLWTMRQYAGFGDAKSTNERFKYLIEQGQTGLSVAFDLPTQMGYDSDDAVAEGEVGRVGVAISTLEDFAELFAGLDPAQISVSMTINSTAPILLGMYLVLAERGGVDWDELRGTVQNDILKEYFARGTYIYPPQPGLRLAVDLIRFTSERVPKWNSISISGYHIREAGASAVQELAFTFADAIEYVKGALAAGLDIDTFAPRLSFFFNAHNDLFEEAAKFRAARRIWHRIITEEFGAKNAKSAKLRFHVQTAGSTLTAAGYENNAIRVTLQALSAVLGGAQSIHTNSRDEALGLPTEDSVRLALRTQQVIAYESGATDSADPLGGSYYVEHLTDEIERRVEDYLKTITEMGGAPRCIESGYFADEIADSAYRQQMAINKGELKVVGVNCFEDPEQNDIEILHVEPALGEARRTRLAEYRAKRNGAVVDTALAELKAAAEKEGAPLMEPIIECVRAGATVGEISGALREIFGTYDE
ncbi:MAG: methylmalonyl-CoA mutase [bacterium]|nr:methylmalonyl-CoA mutase [bacterium]